MDDSNFKGDSSWLVDWTHSKDSLQQFQNTDTKFWLPSPMKLVEKNTEKADKNQPPPRQWQP